MPISFSVDTASKVPPFDQIKHTVIEAIETKSVNVDEKLPAIRALATELGLAVNTVARSYRELEEEGYVVTQGRSGTRISSTAVPSDIALSQLTREYVAKLRELGIDKEKALSAVETAFSA